MALFLAIILAILVYLNQSKKTPVPAAVIFVLALILLESIVDLRLIITLAAALLYFWALKQFDRKNPLWWVIAIAGGAGIIIVV